MGIALTPPFSQAKLFNVCKFDWLSDLGLKFFFIFAVYDKEVAFLSVFVCFGWLWWVVGGSSAVTDWHVDLFIDKFYENENK